MVLGALETPWFRRCQVCSGGSLHLPDKLCVLWMSEPGERGFPSPLELEDDEKVLDVGLQTYLHPWIWGLALI